MDDDHVLWVDNTSARLRRLPFEMADRFSDDERFDFGQDGADAQWDLHRLSHRLASASRCYVEVDESAAAFSP